jgi:hypothetical protein
LPQNVDPQPVRLHPGKPYFCFAPTILGEFAIAPVAEKRTSPRAAVKKFLPRWIGSADWWELWRPGRPVPIAGKGMMR